MAYYFKLPPITDLTIGQQAALNEPNAIAISGGPGTGKSVVSLWRHIRNYGTMSKRSLLLTYTKTLETYLAASAGSENVSAGNAVDRTYWWTTHNASKYDEIIVDEAQDVEKGRYEIIKKYSGIVSYGADDQQIVYKDRATTQKQLVSLFSGNRSHVLDENFRNSYEIMHFVRALFPNKIISQAILNDLLEKGRRGNKPILLLANDSAKADNAIIDIIRQYRSETHNIAVLVPLGKYVDTYYNLIMKAGITCSKFKKDDGMLGIIENVHITTFKSSKGTEFDTVIIPDFDSMPSFTTGYSFLDENDYYVGVTRSRRNLYLICNSMPLFLEQSDAQKRTYSKEIL